METAAEPFPCSEGPEDFGCILPITVIELCDDDFLEIGDKEHMDLNVGGCLIAHAKEERRIDSEVKELSNSVGLQSGSGEERGVPLETTTAKNSGEEMPVSCEKFPSVHMGLVRKALDIFFCDQDWAVGFFDYTAYNGTENEHNYCQKILPSDWDADNQKEDEQTIEGAVRLDSGANKTDNRPKKCGKLQVNLLLVRKCEEYQNSVNKNNADVSPVKDFSGDAEDGSNLGLGAAGPYVQPSGAGGLAENGVQEGLHKSIQFGQQLQMEPSEKMSLRSSKLKNNTASMKHVKRKGTRKCLFCNFRYTFSTCLRKHMGVAHKDKRRYRCDFCCRNFFFSSSLWRHQQLHAKIKRKETGRDTQENGKPKVNGKPKDRIALKKRKKEEKNADRSTSEGPHSQICKCKLCDYPAHRKGRRKRHTDKKLHRCNVCDKQFSTPDHLKWHKLLHPDVDRPRKSHSHARKQESPSRLGHETSKPVSKTYACGDCGLVFCKKCDLQHHEGVHLQTLPERGSALTAAQPSRRSVVKILKCHQCDYTTELVRDWQTHMTAHAGEKAFWCQECGKSFRSSSHLKRHSMVHLWKPYRCQRCLFMSSTVEKLKIHQENCNRKDAIKKRRRPSGLRSDSTEKQLAMAETNKGPLALQDVGSEPYRCDQCDYVTYKLPHLKHHKCCSHRPEPLKCGCCDFSTDDGQCLKKHIASHTNACPSQRHHLEKESSLAVKVYKCDECDYVTDRNENLKVHLRIHTGERPYKCSRCSFAFRTSSHLNRHSATHLKMQCPKCQFLAHNKQALRKHKKTHRKTKSREPGKGENS